MGYAVQCSAVHTYYCRYGKINQFERSTLNTRWRSRYIDSLDLQVHTLVALTGSNEDSAPFSASLDRSMYRKSLHTLIDAPT